MNTRPPELTDDDIADALRAGWDITPTTLEYEPVGFGAHHWIAEGAGERWFVTVHDLLKTRWLADTAAGALAALHNAFAATQVLRAQGLDFVAAPIGEPVRALTDRHSIAVYPYMEGKSASDGAFDSDDLRDDVLRLLTHLHDVRLDFPTSEEFEVPARAALEGALADLGTEWSTGPLAEPARAALAEQAEYVRHALAAYDDFARAARASNDPFVLTHGEPHAANVMTTPAGVILIDWDTLRLAPRERDLARVVGIDIDEAGAYSGPVNEDRLALFSLWWDLADLALYTSIFREPHAETEDTSKMFQGLCYSAQFGEHWPGLID